MFSQLLSKSQKKKIIAICFQSLKKIFFFILVLVERYHFNGFYYIGIKLI